VSLGLKRGDVVSILADTIPKWLYADMGTMGAAASPTASTPPIRPSRSTTSERQPLALPVVENDEQLDKFLEVRERCRRSPKVFIFDMRADRFQRPQNMPTTFARAGTRLRRPHPGLWRS